MRKRFGTALIVAAVVLLFAGAVPALASCQYCGGGLLNKSCRDVDSTHKSGTDDCSNDFYGNCIANGNSCSYGGANCTEGGICEEFQTRVEPSGKRDSEPRFLEDFAAPRLPGLIIES